jgi:hypothetical protein
MKLLVLCLSVGLLLRTPLPGARCFEASQKGKKHSKLVGARELSSEQ